VGLKVKLHSRVEYYFDIVYFYFYICRVAKEIKFEAKLVYFS